MKKLAAVLRLWPVFLLLAVYILAYYNVDYFLIPTLIKLDFTRGQILFIAGSWGFLDMLGGYIAWSGFRSLMAKVFEKDINFMKKVAGEEKTKGTLETIQVYFVSKYLKFLNGNGGAYAGGSKNIFYRFADGISDRMIRIVIRILRGGSYMLIFLIGLSPIPGPRMVSDIFCGTIRWKKGFITVALGNFVKTAGFVYGWDWFFS